MKSLILVLVLAFPFAANAATNVPQTCKDSTLEGHPAQDCISALEWNLPLAPTLVLTRPLTSTSNWDSTTTWLAWNKVTPAVQYRVCPSDLTPPAADGAQPDGSYADPCGSSAVWIPGPQNVQSAINGRAALTFTWDLPTQDENGGALASDAITGYTLFYGPKSRAGRSCAQPVGTTDSTCYPNRAQFVPGVSAPLSLQVTGSQSLFFAITTNGKGGLMSDYSAELPVQFTLSTVSVPAAPKQLKVTGTMTCDAGPNMTCTLTLQTQ